MINMLERLLPLKDLTLPPSPLSPLKIVKVCKDAVPSPQLVSQLVFQGFLYFPLISACFLFT